MRDAAPNLSADVPELLELAQQTGSPVPAGSKDGRTWMRAHGARHQSQAARRRRVITANILGKPRRRVLDDPESFGQRENRNRSSTTSAAQSLSPDLPAALPSVDQFTIPAVTLTGRLGQRRHLRPARLSDAAEDQLLCRDSILAPHRLDVALFWISQAAHMRGIQEWLSFYQAMPRALIEHDLCPAGD